MHGNKALLAPFAALLILTACSQEDSLSIYRVPKEDDAVPAAGQGAGGVQWSAPADWKEEPASGMRVASFALPGPAEVSVIALPGDAGGDLANVNRWRGQLGLGAIGESELKRQARGLSSSAGELLVVEFSSPQKGAMIGGRLIAAGQSWFFKMTGSKDAVAKNKTAFTRFLSGLKAGAGSAPQPMADMPAPEAPAGSLGWKLPEGWKQENGSGMRVATLRAAGAEVSVIALPGDAGGDLANVNRWRGQLGLAPISDPELAGQSQRFASPAGEVLLVDLSSPGKGRMVGARLYAGGQSWFFKMTGPNDSVARSTPAFQAMLRSLKLEAQ